MCGRYASPDQAVIEREWRIGRHNNRPFRQVFDVPPGLTVPIVRQPADLPIGNLELLSARWGLVPQWWTGDKPPPATHNAISETAASESMWQEPLRNARCIVPALGWYEWPTAQISGKIPGQTKPVMNRHYIHQADQGIIGFAGMMSWWNLPDDTVSLVSCAILTAPAAPSILHLHHRMPVALAKAGQSSWMDPQMKDAGRALEILRDCAISDFAFHRVAPTIAPGLEPLNPM